MLYTKQFMPIVKNSEADVPLLTVAGYCQGDTLWPLGVRVQQRIWQQLLVGFNQLGLQAWLPTVALSQQVDLIGQAMRSYKQLPLLLCDQQQFFICHVDETEMQATQQQLEAVLARFCAEHAVATDDLWVVQPDLVGAEPQHYLLNAAGKNKPLLFACYQLCWSLLLSRLAEKYSDDVGLCWPDSLSPYDYLLIPLRYQKSYRVREATDQLYQQLLARGFCVLLDDRKERPGVMLAEGDLLGISQQIIIGEKALDQGMVEYKNRGAGAKLQMVDIKEIVCQ